MEDKSKIQLTPYIYWMMVFALLFPAYNMLTKTRKEPIKPKLEQRATVPYCKIDQDYYGLHQSLQQELWIYDQSACEVIDPPKRVADIWNTKPDKFVECDVNDEGEDGQPTNMALINITPVDDQMVTWQHDKLYRASDRLHPTRKFAEKQIGFCGKIWKIGELGDKYIVLLGHVMTNTAHGRATTSGLLVGNSLKMVKISKSEYDAIKRK